jgi:Protein of unknown function (DUF3667)
MGVSQSFRKPEIERELKTEPRSAACLNCDTPLSGPFCSSCGQRDIPPYPSTRELAIDAFWELSGWDGRFASTVRALVRQPGLLTREFLEGRRARYISPLRLYLLASLAYFLVAAAAPDIKLASGKTLRTGLYVGSTVRDTTPVSRPERVGGEAARALESQSPLTAAERDSALKDIAKAPEYLQPLLRRAVEDPNGIKRGMFAAMPRMLFALLPVFAAIVALFYHKRKYPEHLYFAIHLHSFIFLALALSPLARFTHSPAIAIATQGLVFLAIPVYATLAFRRAYGGSVAMTLAKELGIGAIYCLVSSVALIATVFIVSIAG